ncbi:MAG: inositol monophosphatase family protein [Candidatus Eiseniibacteriota bacterium]
MSRIEGAPLEAWHEDAIAIARAAGQILREGYGRPGAIDYKGGIDLVTAYDRRSEAFLVGELTRRFPGHAILGEEGGAAGSAAGGVRGAAGAASPAPPFRWVLDPLDGTTNFAHNYPFFAVSLALEVDGVRTLGVVYDPLRDECFAARRGHGATLNGIPIRVTAESRFERALAATGFAYDVHEKPEETLRFFAPFLSRVQGIRRDGSAALNLAYLACGRFDLFWEVKLHPWDIAAAVLIVEEAGGRVTDFAGGPVPWDGFEVAGSNGALHAELIGILQKIPRLVRT